MTARALLAALVVASATGCAAEIGNVSQMRGELDEYTIQKPLAESWTEALRFLNARGYQPVGADRKLLGLPEMGRWATAASKGRPTEVSGTRWTADTAADGRGKRYRIIGLQLTESTSRIGFFAVYEEGVVSSSELRGRETMNRDVVAELEFLEKIDPATAAKMRPKDPGFF